ncbi:hypothetical protein SAMN05660691_03736 [Rheinheimera pacifica]|uniref:DUF1365 domain-containing protein n=1 Tax=Rheinheimera pacifica TaxID=173990 RepID=A0A1H6NKB1_9GAMM|nr:DUF1365 domain-containing protein [Rheinheimera pacifica]SEI10818.1 hypothetical protein SAMN05660691_03736 [Rheinheimera pacifica]
MHSGHAVYQGEVGHLRVSPLEYGFSYPLAHYWLDCSMLDKTSLQASGIAFERFGALSFRRKDYLPGSGSVHSAVCSKVAELGGTTTPAKVYILTPLANWGLYFSPLTLYYCYDEQDHFCYLLAEVTNTPWNERHYYLQTMPLHALDAGLHHFVHEKAFHVSPFHPMKMQYHWQISTPDQHLQCSIRNTEADKQIFSAWISLTRHELSAAWRRKWLIRQPWQNVQVVLRIYWHAVKLYLKGIPVHAHPKTKDTNA